MAKKKEVPKNGFTDVWIGNLSKPSKGERHEYIDKKQTGLILRVTDRHKKYWRLRYRVKGLSKIGKKGAPLQGGNQSMTIGQYPTMSLDDARTEAKRLWDIADGGKDPAQTKLTEALDLQEQQALTFKVVAENFLDEAKRGRNVSKKKITSSEFLKRYQLDLEQVVFPALGHRPIGDITTPELVAFFDEVDRDPRTKKFPSRVDRVLNAVRAVFYFATQHRHYIEINPVAIIKARNSINERDRWLDDVELRALWKATEGLGNFGKIMRVLALTAQRSGEVRNMTWRDLDLEKATWTLPSAKAKNRRVHVIPLTKTVLKIIEDQPRGKPEDYVFHGEGGGTKKTSTTPKQTIPLSEKMLEILQKDDPEAELEHWVPHDLRRTVNTNLAAMRFPIPIIKLILNHDAKKTLGSNDGIYNQHRYGPEIREALEAWDLKLRQIVSGLKEVKETA